MWGSGSNPSPPFFFLYSGDVLSTTYTIGNNRITLPDVNSDPNWAEGLVDFFEAVADALQQAVGTYDIVPQTFVMSANANTNVEIPALSFPTATVRAATIRYSIYRTTSTANEAETGLLHVLYNSNNGTGLKWEMSREFTGLSTVSFAVSDAGQISFTSTSIAGTGHAGSISFAAQALQQQY